MKVRTTIAGLVLGAAATAGMGSAYATTNGSGSTAGLITAPTPTEPATSGSKAAIRCERAPKLEASLTARLTKLRERLRKLEAALATATAHGNTARAAKIQGRIDHLQTRTAHLTALDTKLSVWVSAHCSPKP